MSQPVRVDSEISFKSNPEMSAQFNTQIDQDRQDAISECGSMYEGQPGEAFKGELHTQILDMASLISDMMKELKTLKLGSNVDPDQLSLCRKDNTNQRSEPSRLDTSYAKGPLPGCDDRALNYREGSIQISQQARFSGSRPDSQRIPVSHDFNNLDGNRINLTDGRNRNCSNVGGAQVFDRHAQFDDRNLRSYQPSLVRPYPAYFRGDMGSPLTKLKPFNGQNDWCAWIAQFEAIARRLCLSENDMLDQLLPRLEGQAAEFAFTQLPPAVLDSYALLREEMESRFQTIETSRSFASRFYRRSHRHNETLEEYAADLKRLYDRAHGYRSKQTRDEDLVRRFMDGLEDEDLKFAIEFNKDPSNIDEALYYAVNYVQIKGMRKHGNSGQFITRRVVDGDKSSEDESDPIRSARERQGARHDAQMDERTSLLRELLDRVIKLEEKCQGKRGRVGKECFNCHQVGHFARDCPNKVTDQERFKEAEEPLNGNRPHLVAKEGSH